MNKKLFFVGLVFVLFAGVIFTANAATKVSLSVEKQGNGVIKSDDGKINCGTDCKEVYYSGGSVTLNATPADGFTFEKWTGNACVAFSASIEEDASGACSVSLDYNKNKKLTAKAHFKKISKGSGGGNTTSTATDGGNTNSAATDNGTTSSAYGGNTTSTAPSKTKSSSSKSSNSSSSTHTTYTLKVEKNGKGTVTSDDGKINCGSDCKEVYYSGGSIGLTATPMEGFTFDKWTGNACSNKGYEDKEKDVIVGHCIVTLDGKSNAKSQTLTAKAHFKKISTSSSSKTKSSSSKSSNSSKSSFSTKSKSSSSSATSTVYMLKVNKSGKGYVSDVGKQIDCGSYCKGQYGANSKAKLTAVPNGSYVFKKFTPEKECESVYSDGFGFNDNKLIKQAFAYGPAENVVCVTTMNKNKTITAVFEKIKK